MYYRGAVAAVLVYDITSVSSFHAVKGWIKGEAPVMSSRPSTQSLKRYHCQRHTHDDDDE